jgi:hypothetical protein
VFQFDFSLKGNSDNAGFRDRDIFGTEFDPIPFIPTPVTDVPDNLEVAAASPFGKYVAVFRLTKPADVPADDIEVVPSLILKVKRRSVKLADDADLTPFTRDIADAPTQALIIIGTNDETLKDKFVFVIAKLPLDDKAGLAVGQLQLNPKHNP